MKSTVNEFILIKELIKVNDDYNDLRLRRQQLPDNITINEQFLKINTILLSYKERFEKIDNKISLEICTKLKYTFINWIDSLSNIKDPYGISRSMGMFDKYLIVRIEEEIKDIYSLKKDSSSLIFIETNNPQDVFEKEIIIEFLKKQIVKLLDLDVINYFNLTHFYNSFFEEVKLLIP